MIEADIRIKNLNTTKSRKKRQAEKKQIEISLTTQNGERVQIITKKDLKWCCLLLKTAILTSLNTLS